MHRFLIVPLLTLCAGALSAKSHVAERFDVRVRVLPDASLEVTETIRFLFEGGHYSFVTRAIPKRGTDGIDDVRTWMDGSRATADVEEDNSNVSVKWHFDAPADSRHDFTLQYRVTGAVRRESSGDVVLWRAIPDRHDYRILGGEITVEYPPGVDAAVSLTRQRAVAAGREAGRAVFSLPELNRDEGASVRAVFPVGFAPNAKQDRTRPGLVTGAGAMAVGLILGVLLLIRLRASLPPNAPVIESPEPIHGLTPAVAAKLGGGGQGAHRAMGTLLDLARRGVVAIREREGSFFSKKKYDIVPVDLQQPRLPYESRVLDMALGEFSKFVSRLGTSSGSVTALVNEHMRTMGLVDPERVRAKRQWIAGGVVALLLSLAVGGAALLLGWPAGPAMGGLAAAGFAIGLVAMMMSATISTLSAQGAMRAGPCRGLKSRLHGITRGDSAAAEDFERWLPFAVAFGLGSAWVKRFKKMGGVPMPEWFDGGDVGDFAFFDFVSASSAGADAGSSGGGDGGGGAGGGSSSAG